MKKLLLTISILITAMISIAQERAQLIGAPTTAIRAQGSLYVDSFLFVPIKTTVNLARLYRPGALAYQISDSSYYAWTGNQWLKVQGGEGGGGTPANLSFNKTSNSITITNTNGSGFTFPIADGVDAGAVSALDYQKWSAKLDQVNLGMNRTPTGVSITSSAGAPTTIPLVDNALAGVVSPAKYAEWNSKISGISTQYSIQNNGSSASPTQLVGDVAAPGSNMVYGTNALGSRGWKPDPSGGGGGSSEVITTTYDAFQASTGLNVAKLYYITTPGREGYFTFVQNVANQTTDNGGTIIVNASNQQFVRWYTGPIFAEWFGLVESTTDPGSTQKTANVTAIRAALSAAGNWERVTTSNSGKTAAAAYWLNDSIMLKATFDKHYNFDGDGASFKFTHNGNGFIIDGGFGSRFTNDGGRIIGPGTGATDSTSFAAYTGAGVLLRNCFNSSVTVWEVEGWKHGIESNGEAYTGVGTTAYGSQMNTVTYSWVHHNYIQIKIATYGAAGTAGNWANETYWYCKGQLGRGIPHVTYGGGGWYGLVMTKDPSSTAVTYGMNSHVFYNLNIEGVEHGVVMDNTENNVFYGSAVEPGGSRYQLNLDPATAKDNQFLGGAPMGEYYFVPGRTGLRTILEKSISGKSGGNPNYAASRASSIPALPAMTGYSDYAGKLLLSSDHFQGFTALEALDNGANLWHWMKLSQYPTTINGWMKYEGEFRGGMYKPTYLPVTAGSAATLTAPPNLGYIRFDADEATTVTLNDGDDINHSRYFETFKVEYNVAQPLTIKNAQGTTVINSSNFTTLGTYEIVWRSSVFVVKPPSTGGAGSINPVAVGGTPNDNGFTYNSGNLQLNPADIDDPGVVVEGSQVMPSGVKTFTEVNAGTLTVQGSGFGSYKFVGRQNGMSWNDVNGTPNPSSTGFTVVNYGSGSNTRDMVVGMGKTATNFNGMGNNGSDLVLFGEKVTGGFEFRNNVGFASFALNGGNLRGKIFGNGNWLIQSGGTPTDAGYKLDVQGSARITGPLYLDDYANADAMMMVVNPDKSVGVQPIPTGGTTGSTIFSAGSGTGTPHYRLFPVNFGANPAQSWAWNTFGPSCLTCGPGSTQRAIWEWSSTSAYVPTPRLHSWDYNGTDPRFTNGTGIPARLLTEFNAVPISGPKPYESTIDIEPQYISKMSAADGDHLVASTSAAGAEYRAPNYERKLALGADQTTTSTSEVLFPSPAVGNDDREAIPIGSSYKLTMKGRITVTATTTDPILRVAVGNFNESVSVAFGSLSNRMFEMVYTITRKTSGTHWQLEVRVNNSLPLVYEGDAAAWTTTGVDLTAGWRWGVGGNSITFKEAYWEIFRLQ